MKISRRESLTGFIGGLFGLVFANLQIKNISVEKTLAEGKDYVISNPCPRLGIGTTCPAVRLDIR